MGNQQYALHFQIVFVPPRKLGLSLAYQINPTHGDISISDQQYQNTLHNYNLVKIINRSLKKITVIEIDDQCLKGAKDMVMVFANKSFVELLDWLYIQYGQITPWDLMKDQDTMQTSYHVEEPTEILFNHIETGQEFTIAWNSPISDRQLADMGIALILEMQAYTHVYHTWKIVSSNEHTWVNFKAHF